MYHGSVSKWLSLLIVLLVCSSALAQDVPKLEYQKYVLDNGLQVILHEDHTIPMVSVNVWYHTGSKNEKPGRTGFAHLFEHMMFQGSENHDTDYFLPLQKVGGVINGSTTEDRTNYWENVPSNQLELALWLESDRMGYLLPAMTQERLDNQIDVVKNEKRQGDNQPYAKSEELLMQLLFPDEHPYSHTVIGSLDDLGAASLEDVGEFFKLYYAPNNASLCIAGDFEPAVAKDLVEKYFGSIPPGRPVDRLESWIPKMEGVRRTVAEDDVELPRLYYAWTTPGYYQPGDAEMDLLSSILTSGKTSRLYKSLVYDLQIAQDVDSYQESRELCSVFAITATAQPGHSLSELEFEIDKVLKDLFANGITEDELELAKTSYETGFVRGLQRVGGFGGKADRLNRYNTFAGDPGYLAQDLGRYRQATTKSVLASAKEFLSLDNRAVLNIVTQGSLEAAEPLVDRSVQPGGTRDAGFRPPELQQATLSNGLELYLVEKHELPLVDMDLLIKSGWAADPTAKPGTAALTAELLDEGTRSRDALEIAEEARRLGAQLGTGGFFDGTVISLNVLKRNLDAGLELVADLVVNPTFPEEEFERQRQIYLGRIQQESMQPIVTGIKILLKQTFGEGHPYAQPFTGSGTEASLKALTRDDFVRFHADHFHPNNAAVVVAGDLTLAEAKEQVERAFRKWKRGTAPAMVVPEAAMAEGPRVSVVHRPGAQQTVILAGLLSMNRNAPDYQAFQVMNRSLGGQFSARLNMNLREDKGYTYGARSQLASFKEAGVFFCMAPVHTEFTKESLIEITKELNEVKGARPVTAEELKDAKSNLTMSFPQRFETFGGITNEMFDLVMYNLPRNDWQTYMDRVRGIDSGKVTRVLEEYLPTEDLRFVIIGDWEQIEDGVRELNLGEIQMIDPGSL